MWFLYTGGLYMQVQYLGGEALPIASTDSTGMCRRNDPALSMLSHFTLKLPLQKIFLLKIHDAHKIYPLLYHVYGNHGNGSS